MRLMLGTEGIPSLLVTVEDFDNNDNFDFYVVNGAWHGKFSNGFITIFGAPGGDFSTLDHHVILTQNQDRLRGDYNDVFNNFDDEKYIAPKSKVTAYWDDDVPF